MEVWFEESAWDHQLTTFCPCWNPQLFWGSRTFCNWLLAFVVDAAKFLGRRVFVVTMMDLFLRPNSKSGYVPYLSFNVSFFWIECTLVMVHFHVVLDFLYSFTWVASNELANKWKMVFLGRTNYFCYKNPKLIGYLRIVGLLIDLVNLGYELSL